MAKVKLIIKTLPDLPTGAKYKCVFGKADPIDAEVNEYGLACYTPGLSQRPRIPPRQDHTLVPLSVRSSETNQDFVSRNFAYYDCSRHSTCRECVKSQWACNWCVYENKCSHNISSCQRTVISGENVSHFTKSPIFMKWLIRIGDFISIFCISEPNALVESWFLILSPIPKS